MTYANIILLVLQVIYSLLKKGQENHWISVGEDREILRSSVAIIKLTQAAKEADDEVAKLDDVAVARKLGERGEFRD